MSGFVNRLVQELLAPTRALSRNRHFDTFDDASGRRALRVSRHLRSLERAILAPAERPPQASREERDGQPVVRLELSAYRVRRVAYLSPEEFGLLLDLPGVRQALGLSG